MFRILKYFDQTRLGNVTNYCGFRRDSSLSTKIDNFQGEATCSAGLRFVTYNSFYLWAYNRQLSVGILLKTGENDTKILYINLSR